MFASLETLNVPATKSSSIYGKMVDMISSASINFGALRNKPPGRKWKTKSELHLLQNRYVHPSPVQT